VQARTENHPTAPPIYGGIEAGGTKWVCAAGTAPDGVLETATIPTTSPAETIARAAAFFARHSDIVTVGVGSFGPLDLRRSSPTWGHITTTPKQGWSGTDVAGELARALGVPVALDTDVNVAALAEHRWGAAVGLGTFCYITVGTGIGGGALVDGELLHGLIHPEFGHMRVPHDRERDPFAGACPYHGDCLEGLASGHAIRMRWGVGGEEADDARVWELEAEYLALGVVNVTSVLSPERVVIGGGVMQQPTLLPRIRRRVGELLGGYFGAPALAGDLATYIVPPALGARAGSLGALELARLARASGDDDGAGMAAPESLRRRET
jgi:fructokinase